MWPYGLCVDELEHVVAKPLMEGRHRELERHLPDSLGKSRKGGKVSC